MDVRISPSRLSGSVSAVSSKSHAHRLLICAALAQSETEIRISGLSEDIMATARCLEAMGCSVRPGREGLRVSPMPAARHGGGGGGGGAEPAPRPGKAGRPGSRRAVLDCGESGTTARLLLPIAAHFFDEFALAGSGKLPSRPFAPLCDALAGAGCAFDGDSLPLSGRGRALRGSFRIAGNVSSQFVSGLLLLLPLLEAGSSVAVTTELESAGYVDMTVEAMSLFGIAVERFAAPALPGDPPLPPGAFPAGAAFDPDGSAAFDAGVAGGFAISASGGGAGKAGGATALPGYRVRGSRRYESPGFAAAEGDWSNAAFFLCMGALAGPVSVRGLSLSSGQGDREVLEILRRFGAGVEIGFDGEVTVSPGPLRGIGIDASQIPDLVPALAAVAALAEGETRIFNARRLRLKESDRIKTTSAMLSALGADIRALDDGLAVRGRKRLRGGDADGAGDHRIVMAAAAASCACDGPVSIRGFSAANKSYPAFFGDFRTIGGRADVF